MNRSTNELHGASSFPLRIKKDGDLFFASTDSAKGYIWQGSTEEEVIREARDHLDILHKEGKLNR